MREPSVVGKALGSWRFRGDRILHGRSCAPSARTLGGLLDEQTQRFADNEAVIGVGARLSYRDLSALVDRVALGLIGRGVTRGDHVAILLGNRPEWIVLWLALNRIGAVAVGVSSWSSPSELAYILRHSDARLLIHGNIVGPRALVPVVRACLDEAGWTDDGWCPHLPCLFAVTQLAEGEGPAETLAELIEAGARVPHAMIVELGREVQPADVALLLYTSGSTATPKGVQLVHRILIENAFDIGEAEGLQSGDRFWVSLPLFWSAGSANTAMAVLTHGATMVLQEYFDAPEAARLLREERCTHYFAFPNVTRAIRDALGDEPLPAARVAVSSGQPEVLAMLKAMGFQLLLHPYGTTEDYGFATINGEDETQESLVWSQGRALPGMELKICDPGSGDTLPHGSPGEICLRGNVTIGYYKDEDKNRAVFDDTGYFHTGDLAVLHPDGRLQFQGRATEMIKTSGFNVSPAEVEAAILGVEGVGEAHVVGIEDPQRGQAIVAFVRLGGAASIEEIRRHCSKVLSSYKCPRAVIALDEFPMTSTGKVSKVALAEIATTPPASV